MKSNTNLLSGVLALFLLTGGTVAAQAPTPLQPGAYAELELGGGPSTARDLVGTSEQPGPDGAADRCLRLILGRPGQVIDWIAVRVDDQVWDTRPANGNPLVMLLRDGKPLNREDGSLLTRLQGQEYFELCLQETSPNMQRQDLDSYVLIGFTDATLMHAPISLLFVSLPPPPSR